MAISNALRTTWSARVDEEMRAGVILDSPLFVNRNFERDAVDANKVTIITYDKVTAKDSGTVAVGDLVEPNDRKVEMPLDQKKTVPWAISRLTEMEINTPAGQAAIRNAGRELARVREQFIAQKMASTLGALNNPSALITASDNMFGPASGNKGFQLRNEDTANAAKPFNHDALLDALRKATIRMDELGVPDDGRRFLLMPPAFRHVVGHQFQLSTAAGEDRLRSGWITELYGCQVYLNNYLHNHTASGTINAGEAVYAIMGHPDNFTFADQLAPRISVHEREAVPETYRVFVTTKYGGIGQKQYALGSTMGIYGNCAILVDSINRTVS